jgi:Flp pilus assembly pilin Flp
MRRQGSGQALIEYVVLLALGSLVAIGAVSLAGRQLADAYSQVSALLANPAAAIVPTASTTPTAALPQTGSPTPSASPTPTPDAPHDTGPDAHANAHAGGNGHSHN